MSKQFTHFVPFTGCANPEHKGDGLCDDGNNNAGCDFDGGDCCGTLAVKQFCLECKCLSKLKEL